MPDKKSPSSNYRTGLRAEALCRFALRLKGWRIVGSRYKSPLGEIDIIAKRGQVVALIEVKARSTHDAAAAAISPRQQERLRRAAHDFLSRHPHFNNHALRFDMMLVAPTRWWARWPVHVPDAWR